MLIHVNLLLQQSHQLVTCVYLLLVRVLNDFFHNILFLLLCVLLTSIDSSFNFMKSAQCIVINLFVLIVDPISIVIIINLTFIFNQLQLLTSKTLDLFFDLFHLIFFLRLIIIFVQLFVHLIEFIVVKFNLISKLLNILPVILQLYFLEVSQLDLFFYLLWSFLNFFQLGKMLLEELKLINILFLFDFAKISSLYLML